MAQPPCTSSPDGEFQSTEGSVGRIRTQQGETNYVGAEHWAAIAGDVSFHFTLIFTMVFTS
jgi:hypothetical protein